MTSASANAPPVVVRRVEPGSDPADQMRGLDRWVGLSLDGWVAAVEVRRVGASIELWERTFSGRCLAEILPEALGRISTTVALGLARDVAGALERLHGLDPGRPWVHGSLDPSWVFLCPDGSVRLGGFSARRGEPTSDVRGALDVLARLLAAKAQRPGGRELLDRLAGLRFESAHDLFRTLDAHLRRQPIERLEEARRRFAASVFEASGGPISCPSGFGPDSDSDPLLVTVPAARAYSATVADGSALEPEEATIQSAAEQHAALQVAMRLALLETEGDPPDVDREPTEAVSAAALRQAGLLLSEVDSVPPPAPTDSAPSPRFPPPLPPADPPEAPDGGPALARADPSDQAQAARRVGPPPVPRDAAPNAPGATDANAAAGLLAPAAAREEREEAVLVGDYRVVAAIGRGGMGEIYLARSGDRLVALKVLGASESGDDDALGMLMDEAAIMARIEHPHVLKVLDFGQAFGRYFLATEYLEGRPLVRVMIESYDRDGGMDHASVAWVGAQAARGLHAAHTATTASGAPLEVVHRDVSPQNIFVTYAGVAKVIDFGVARATERFSRTQVGLVKGKAAYMSPEQAEGRTLDARSDVFSLGVCLWEMVAGRRLFKRAQDYDTLLAVQTAPVPSPTEVRGRPDPALDRIILRALERDTEVRTPSAEVLAEELEGYARAAGAPDGGDRVRGLMQRLFSEEAARERALVSELSARVATEAEVASLRELSGVSPGGGSEFTLVGEPDALGVLDRYGAEREITGERVIQKVRWHEAARRSGEWPSPPPPPTPQTPPPPPRWWSRARGAWLAGAVCLAAGAAGVLWARLSGGEGDLQALGTRVWLLPRTEVIEQIEAWGGRVDPASGAVRRVSGLDIEPLMLDSHSRVRGVEAGRSRGFLFELTPIEGGPAVVWVDPDGAARGLSINDCPARARVEARGVTVRYGARSSLVPYGVFVRPALSVPVPAGATGVVLEPLALGFGTLDRPRSGLVQCPTGFEGGQLTLQRIPVGQYRLAWSGPGYRSTFSVDVTEDDVQVRR